MKATHRLVTLLCFVLLITSINLSQASSTLGFCHDLNNTASFTIDFIKIDNMAKVVSLGGSTEKSAREGEAITIIKNGKETTDKELNLQREGLAIQRGKDNKGNFIAIGITGHQKSDNALTFTITLDRAVFTDFENAKKDNLQVDGQGDGKATLGKTEKDEVYFTNNSKTVKATLSVHDDSDVFKLYWQFPPTCECTDGKDNEGDGVTDRQDPGCWANPLNPSTYITTLDNESQATTQCQNNRDDDNDGITDKQDPGCWNNIDDSTTYNRTLHNESRALPFEIISITQNPTYPRCSQDVTICATIANRTNITDYVKIIFNTATGNAMLTMKHAGNNQYCSTLSKITLNAYHGLNVAYTITGQDKAGHQDQKTDNSYTYDCTAPNITIITPNNTCEEGTTLPLVIQNNNQESTEEWTYAWDLDQDGEYDDATTPSVNYICEDDGNYDVAIQVTDESNNKGYANTTLTITNSNPEANANGPYHTSGRITYQLQGSVKDQGRKDSHTYTWDYNNDSTFETNGKTPSFTCTTNATYTLALQVTDDDGGIGYDYTTLTCSNIIPPLNPTQCQDGKDNDNDGLTDLGDPDCTDITDDDESGSNGYACSNGIDDDNDGNIDLTDYGCENSQDNDEQNNGNYQCNNGQDDDNDNKIDQEDQGCSSWNDDDETEPTIYQCNDGIDNDQDGLTDMNDPDCSTPEDNHESHEQTYQCSDFKDNDGDGKIDMQDPDCNNPRDNSEKRITKSSGGSSNNVCKESWTCSPFDLCDGSIQTRTCTDTNHCGTTKDKPVTLQSCNSITVTTTHNAVFLNGNIIKEQPKPALKKNETLPNYFWILIIAILILAIITTLVIYQKLQ